MLWRSTGNTDAVHKGTTPCEEPREANLQLLFFPFNCSFQFPQSLSISAVTDSFNYNQRSCGVQENSSSLTYYISLWNSNLFSLVDTWWISSSLNYRLLLYLLLVTWCLFIQLIPYSVSNAWWYHFTFHISYSLPEGCGLLGTLKSAKCGEASHTRWPWEESHRVLRMRVFFPSVIFSSPKLILCIVKVYRSWHACGEFNRFYGNCNLFSFSLDNEKIAHEIRDIM